MTTRGCGYKKSPVPLGTIKLALCQLSGFSIHWWKRDCHPGHLHYDDVIMIKLASQITSLTVVYSIVYSGVNQRKHQSSASLAFVQEIHRGPVNFSHKWPVTRKMFPFDDVIMIHWKYAVLRGIGIPNLIRSDNRLRLKKIPIPLRRWLLSN